MTVYISAADRASERYWGWTSPHDSDNQIEVVEREAGSAIHISVSEERAMDSYNQTFTCSVTLGIDDARALRDHLSRVLDEYEP